MRVRALVAHRDGEGPVVATLVSLATGDRWELDCDALIFATGYRPVCPLSLLGQSRSLCLTGEDGMVCVERDYRIATTPGTRAGIYLRGAT